jgi:hypothetical protein
MQNRHCSGHPLELLGAENKNTKYVKALGEPIGKKQPDASSFIYLFIFYSYVHRMFGSFLPLSPPFSFLPTPPFPLPPTWSLPGRNYFALISNFVEERI